MRATRFATSAIHTCRSVTHKGLASIRRLSTSAPVTSAPAAARIVSGIQPSGSLHLGNYLGAIDSWVKIQNGQMDVSAALQSAATNPSTTPTSLSSAASSSSPSSPSSVSVPPLYIFIADLHALTVRPDPAALRAASLEMTATLLSCGIDPSRTVLFCQSHVRAHVELSWIFSCLTPHTWLNRMTQFKDKSQALADSKAGPGAREAQSPSLGLFAYPVLQAADILLYRATGVPVGKDQFQHVELCRDIALQFNNQYASNAAISAARAANAPPPFSFPLPAHIATPTSRVMSLLDGKVKMSKSDPRAKSRISLTDDDDSIRQKIKKAVTDSDAHMIYDPESRPATANLIEIYSALNGRTVEQIMQDESLRTKQAFKAALTDQLISTIAPIRTEFSRIAKDEAYLSKVLAQGAEKANTTAEETIRLVKNVVGLFVPK